MPPVPRPYVTAVVLLAAAALGTASCSNADNTPPVATVSVTPARTEVPIGSPLELSYQFNVTSTAGIPADYRVFVQMLNADRQIVWSDDHDPAIPTSQWKRGQTVRYERTRFLPPAVLQPGDITIEVGLYRDADRLPLLVPDAAESSPQRAYPVASLKLTPESENVFLIYKAGWHTDEFPPDNPAVSWKWTQKSATVSFRHPRTDAVLLLEYDARPDLFSGGPQQVTVFGANNDQVAAFAADSVALRLERIPLTIAQMGTADMAEVRIEVDRVFVPAELPSGGRDLRPLGIRVYNAFVERR